MPDILPAIVVPGLYALLYLTALALALIYYRRCPAACSLVITASALNLTATAARLFVQFFWLPRDGDFATFGVIMAGLGLLNWVGYGLMVVAVFVGRQPPARERYPARSEPLDDDWDHPVPASSAPKEADRTGIQERR